MKLRGKLSLKRNSTKKPKKSNPYIDHVNNDIRLEKFFAIILVLFMFGITFFTFNGTDIMEDSFFSGSDDNSEPRGTEATPRQANPSKDDVTVRQVSAKDLVKS